MPFSITIHMVSSLDGYIARKDNSISWFDTKDKYEDGIIVSKEEAQEFLKKIDCYIMGSHTYELAVDLSKTYGWAYGDIPTYVLSQRDLSIERKNIQLYSGDLVEFVNEKLKPNYQNVWLVGGMQLTKKFLRLNLADEIRHSILPIIIGGGTLFYDQVGIEQLLHLKKVTAYKNGMVELHYEVRK